MILVFSTPWFQTGNWNLESSGDITQLIRLEEQLEPHVEKLILTPKPYESLRMPFHVYFW